MLICIIFDWRTEVDDFISLGSNPARKSLLQHWLAWSPSKCSYRTKPEPDFVKKVGKGIFVTRDRPFFFPVKCEMGYFFLVNRDFHTSREAWFCKIIIRETRNECLIRREPWFSWWLLFRELWKDRFIFRETWSRPPLLPPSSVRNAIVPLRS